MCITQAVNIFGTGIVAGTFVIGTIAVHPAVADDKNGLLFALKGLLPPAAPSLQ